MSRSITHSNEQQVAAAARSQRSAEKKTMPPKKLLFVLFVVLSAFSFARLFRILIKTSTPSQPPPSPTNPNPSTLSRYAEDSLTAKEHRLLSDLISRRAPCNLIVFGLNPQLLSLSELNTGGTTIFLDDDGGKPRRVATEPKAVRIHTVAYREKAGKAYELLKVARANPACRPGAGPLEGSRCELALTELPPEVYREKWDVVVVDGPSGDNAEAPGRMGAIYTAAVIARAGNTTDVLVHDVDRMIEKWYSWEFLCRENLVSSKRKLWHFRIDGNSSSAGFCPESTVHIERSGFSKKAATINQPTLLQKRQANTPPS